MEGGSSWSNRPKGESRDPDPDLGPGPGPDRGPGQSHDQGPGLEKGKRSPGLNPDPNPDPNLSPDQGQGPSPDRSQWKRTRMIKMIKAKMIMAGTCN